jgi:5-methylcytosine-specific restriction enzyme subunit McrC
MLAYCTALQVPRAWLIYAGGGSVARVRRIKHTEIEVVECPLDLSASPSDILSRVAHIADLAIGHMAGEAKTA